MKLNKSFYALLLTGALFAACDSKPAGDVAEVGEAQEVSDIQGDATFSVDTSASKVAWIGLKPGGRHYGTLGLEGGQLQIQNGQVAGGTLEIDLNDIDVKDLEGEYRGKLIGHLKSPDFFDVAQHPKAKFVITSVSKLNGAANTAALTEESKKEVDNDADKFVPEVTDPTHSITGNLTLRDTTLSVTFPAHVELTDNGIQAKARFVIDRTNWGIKFRDDTSPVNRAKDEVIYNNVAVGFDLNAKKQ